jgi:serine protease Do
MLHSFRHIQLQHLLAAWAIGMCGWGHAVAQTPATAPAKEAATPLPAPSSSARELFAQTKDRIVQVRVLLTSANEQSSLGSGFLVRDDGTKGAWVVTNYHVVSSLAMEPGKYRIELRGTNQRTVKAQLMAVDVIHDLAVLRTEPTPQATAWHVLPLRGQPLVQGTKVFSLGNPLELGFLISEGIYNGPVESRIYEQMLFSGAINSGMSGGPAIDESGEVVGVNVATRRDGESLSFLVPVRFTRELLARAWQNPPPTDWRADIARQLLKHQAFITQLLGQAGASPARAFTSQVLAGRPVPTLPSSLTKCWARGLEGEKLRYQRDRLDCNLNADLYVRSNLYAGTVNIEHVLLRNEQLATPQFLALNAKNWTNYGYSMGRGELTPAECHDAYIQAKRHVYRASICVRAYRKFEKLYNFDVQATQVDNAKERQQSSLELNGFSFDNAQQLTRLFLEQLQ